MKKDGRDCVLECGPEKDCHPATCCSIKPKSLTNPVMTARDSEAKNMDSQDMEAVTVISSDAHAHS